MIKLMDNLQSFVQQKKNQEDKEKNLLETIEKKRKGLTMRMKLIIKQYEIKQFAFFFCVKLHRLVFLKHVIMLIVFLFCVISF